MNNPLCWDLYHNVGTKNYSGDNYLSLSHLVQVKKIMCRYLVEQEGSASGSSEACGDKLGSVGQDGVTVGTGEETSPSNVIQEDPPHFAQ